MNYFYVVLLIIIKNCGANATLTTPLDFTDVNIALETKKKVILKTPLNFLKQINIAPLLY